MADDFSIRIEKLSKRYELGERERYLTLRDTISEFVPNLLGRLRRDRTRHQPSPHIWALQDVSLEIRAGEVVGIIGHNGAGKTTLLKVLSRITEPTHGRAFLRGRVGSLLEVGTGFHPELTGRENIFLSGAILGMKRHEILAEFDNIVEFADVSRFLDTPVKRYSSGMYVRLAFAVAAHLQPEILLLDEVLAVGDVEFQRKCIGKMEDIATSGRTVLVVSHSMSTVKALCSRAVLFSKGRLQTFGPVDEVVTTYLKAMKSGRSEEDLATVRYVAGGERLRVRQFRLERAATDGLAVFWKQSLELHVQLEAREPIPGVVLGVALFSLDGTLIFTTHHCDTGAPEYDLQRGLYDVTVRVENPLHPGFYTLHLGANQHKLVTHNLFALNVGTLEVLDHAGDGEVPLAINSQGLITGHSQWGVPVKVDV